MRRLTRPAPASGELSRGYTPSDRTGCEPCQPPTPPAPHDLSARRALGVRLLFLFSADLGLTRRASETRQTGVTESIVPLESAKAHSAGHGQLKPTVDPVPLCDHSGSTELSRRAQHCKPARCWRLAPARTRPVSGAFQWAPADVQLAWFVHDRVKTPTGPSGVYAVPKTASVILATAVAVLAATPVPGQIVVNPRVVEFDPSADHNAATMDGQPLLLRYELAIYAAGSTQVLYAVDLGKPDPGPDGKVRMDFASRLPIWPLADGTYEARVWAVGAAGSGVSEPSNPFTFQSCSINAFPTAVQVSAAGGTAQISVAAGGGCAWAATADAGWVAVSPDLGSGPSSVTLTVAANPAAASRSTTVAVAGSLVSVTQAGAACAFAVSSTTLNLPASGGSGSVSVATTAGCAWTAVSQAAWLTVSPPSGLSAGKVTVTAAKNETGAARVGTVTIAARVVTVSQDGGRRPAAPKGLRLVPKKK